MAILKRILRETVCFASLSFVSQSFAGEVSQPVLDYAHAEDVQAAAQDFVNVLIKNKPEFTYLKLEDVTGPTGTVTIVDNNNLTAIKITSVKVDVSGVPLFVTYSPTISMSADIAPDCTISNEQYVVKPTKIGLDSNFKKDLGQYGHVMFTTLANKILANHSELLNHCSASTYQ